MDDEAFGDERRTLSVRLEIQLDRTPVRGRLRADDGAEQRFEGWLGFVDALRTLHDEGASR
jgi:hypothetical protein